MTESRLRRLAQRWPYGLVVLGVLVLDQITKWLVVQHFQYQEIRTVVPGWFDLTYVLNSGGVWGLGRTLPGPARVAVFLALPSLITVLAVGYAISLPLRDRLRHACIALVIGGAIGNLIDRLRLGEVIDFLSAHWQNKHYWPAFNLADSAICVGIAVLLVATLFEKEHEDDEAAPPAPDGTEGG